MSMQNWGPGLWVSGMQDVSVGEKGGHEPSPNSCPCLVLPVITLRISRIIFRIVNKKIIMGPSNSLGQV